MCDYVERIICAALNGATDEKKSIIEELENDIADLENSDQEDKNSLIEVMKSELEIVKAIDIVFKTDSNTLYFKNMEL